MEYVRAFVVGGIICLIGQIIMDTTKLTSARILVLFVTSGVILAGLGIYEPIAKWGGAGATVPLTGFGYALGKGVMDEVQKAGLLGAFTGGIKSTAGGVGAAVFFGYIMALLFNPRTKP